MPERCQGRRGLRRPGLRRRNSGSTPVKSRTCISQRLNRLTLFPRPTFPCDILSCTSCKALPAGGRREQPRPLPTPSAPVRGQKTREPRASRITLPRSLVKSKPCLPKLWHSGCPSPTDDDDRGPGTGRPPARTADRAAAPSSSPTASCWRSCSARHARRQRGRRRRGRACAASAAPRAAARDRAPSSRRYAGIGAVRATLVLAALELGRRALAGAPDRAASGWPARPRSGRISAAAWRRCSVEEFWALGLDVRHRVQSETCLARGSLTGVEIHPRDVFRPLIRQRRRRRDLLSQPPVRRSGAVARGRRADQRACARSAICAASPCSITSSSAGKATSAWPSATGADAVLGGHRSRACRAQSGTLAVALVAAGALPAARGCAYRRASPGRGCSAWATRRAPTRSATRDRCSTRPGCRWSRTSRRSRGRTATRPGCTPIRCTRRSSTTRRRSVSPAALYYTYHLAEPGGGVSGHGHEGGPGAVVPDREPRDHRRHGEVLPPGRRRRARRPRRRRHVRSRDTITVRPKLFVAGLVGTNLRDLHNSHAAQGIGVRRGADTDARSGHLRRRLDPLHGRQPDRAQGDQRRWRAVT